MSDRYLEKDLAPEERAKALLEEMSLSEKMAQVRGIFPLSVGWDDYDAISRQTEWGIGQVSTLQMRDMATREECCAWQRRIQEIVMANSPHHIPAVFHMEGVCGAFIQDSVSFPSGVARGAGWDPELEERIGETVSRQEAACGVTQVLGPILDVSRDPRMGRCGEPYGEDPTLVSVLGTAYTRGLQKNETAGRRTEGVGKHFLGFHASQGGIHGAHSDIPDRPLREIYAKPFQAAITESGLKGIMPCYCALNGEPVSASKEILQKLLRDEMGFEGVCVSDYSAVGNTHTVQHVGETLEEGGLRCMEAGIDVELPSAMGFNQRFQELFETGRADLSILDRAVLRVLTAKFRMGLFEHPFALTVEEQEGIFSSEEDQKLTLQSALESLVLLKNDGVLPLKSNIRTLAVIGPHGGHANKFFGGYTHLSMAEASLAVPSAIASGEQDTGVKFVPGTQVQSDETEKFAQVLFRQKPDCPSLLETLAEKLPHVQILYAYGYPVAGEDASGFEEALKAISQADAAILTLGGKHGMCAIATMGEGVDGASVNLPPCQEAFLRRAAQLGKPLIGVHLDGRPISSDGADQCLSAILECWSPAEAGAEAIAQVLTGEYNPGGKLPVTVVYHAGQIPLTYNHPCGSAWHQGESIGFPDYVDLPHTPRYPFGFGLSYTTFAYEDLTLDRTEAAPGEKVTVRFTLRNTGTVAGDEVVQLYLKDVYASMTRPVKELAGFCRVRLEPGRSRQVTFQVDTSQTAFLDQERAWKIERGEIQVEVGASSQDIRLAASFRITGDRWIQGKDRAFWAKALL